MDKKLGFTNQNDYEDNPKNENESSISDKNIVINQKEETNNSMIQANKIFKNIIENPLKYNSKNNLKKESEEITIIYLFPKKEKKIKIFDYNFVHINKDKCSIIYNNKEYQLTDYYL